MTDTAQPSGTSSTPDSSGTPAAAVPSSAAPPSPQAVAAEPVAPAAAPIAAPQAVADPAKPVDAPGDKPAASPPADVPTTPLFKVPDDLKVSTEAQTKFETAIKAKTHDGKLTFTPQDVVDLYAEQARDAYALWQKQQVAQDQAWETESKARFSAPQLAAAETGIGFITSFDPQFREVTRSIANHPAFVNAMRIVGERLSEDSFEISGGSTPVQSTPRKAADVLYPRKTA